MPQKHQQPTRFWPTLGVTLGLLVALVGCAPQPTPFQAQEGPAQHSPGYSESSLTPVVWRLSFWANRHTTAQMVEDYLYLRAAQLTQEQAKTHFVVIDRFSLEQPPGPSTTGTFGFSFAIGSSVGMTNWALGVGTSNNTSQNPRLYEGRIIIRLLTAQEASRFDNALEAAAVEAQLAPTYMPPEPLP